MLKFSLLIPIYNGSKFLWRLLESLLNQDLPYDEYEIVCVDDCSSDDSVDIIQEWQKNYTNIRLLVNEKNSRLATNVNKLVDAAEGKYFWLLGQDDYIEPNCLGMLWNKLENEQLEVLLFNYDKVDENGTLLNTFMVFDVSEKMTGIGYLKTQFKDRDYCSFLLGYEWRGVYRTDYWREKKIRCVEGMNFEDTVIMLKAVVYSSAMASIDNVLYHYRVNAYSISYSDNFIKKGEIIFEYAFMVGDEVERFYYELVSIDKDLSDILLIHLKKRFYKFSFDLIRTSKNYKKDFYRKVAENRPFVNSKKKWLKKDARLLLLPYVGYPISCLCESVYRLKKKLFG